MRRKGKSVREPSECQTSDADFVISQRDNRSLPIVEAPLQIVLVFDVLKAPRFLFLVMELPSGEI
jgi:hypothetical protein